MNKDAGLKQKAKFCRDDCPVCTRARKKGRGFLYTLVRLERRVCPYCRAYEELYGKPAYK